VAGVAGPESANNSATSGAFVPMLALGVPSGPIPAVMLAAMMVHGVSPGPLLIKQQPELFWGFIASMYVGNVVLLILNLPLVGVFVNILRVPYPILYPSILAFCILGVYAVNAASSTCGSCCSWVPSAISCESSASRPRRSCWACVLRR